MPDDAPEVAPLEFEQRIADMVQLLASVGCDRGLMAQRTGVSRSDINRLYKAQVKAGQADMRVNLLTLQMQLAQRGNVRMLLHLGEVHLGQKLSREQEGAQGVPDTTDPTDAVRIYVPDNGRVEEHDGSAPVGDGP